MEIIVLIRQLMTKHTINMIHAIGISVGNQPNKKLNITMIPNVPANIVMILAVRGICRIRISVIKIYRSPFMMNVTSKN